MRGTCICHAAAALAFVALLGVVPASATVTDGCELLDSRPVLLGYDVVEYWHIPAYEHGGRGVQGRQQWSVRWRGYEFWFKSEANRDEFVSDPWHYAPVWGGHCSWGVARELAEDGWPWQANALGPPAGPYDGFAIVEHNGEEYLTFNIWRSYVEMFLSDKESNMDAAIDRWTGWFGSLHAGPYNTHCIGSGSERDWCTDGPYEAPWLDESRACPPGQQFANRPAGIPEYPIPDDVAALIDVGSAINGASAPGGSTTASSATNSLDCSGSTDSTASTAESGADASTGSVAAPASASQSVDDMASDSDSAAGSGAASSEASSSDGSDRGDAVDGASNGGSSGVDDDDRTGQDGSGSPVHAGGATTYETEDFDADVGAGAAGIVTDGCALLDSRPVLLGYDVVAYWFLPPYDEGGDGVRGSPSHKVHWRGYEWWFSSNENKELFIADPWAYAPAWGGHCSWGVARETEEDGWPWQADRLGPPAGPVDGWEIVDYNGNKYLTFNIWRSYTERFLEDKNMNMALAISRWEGWFGKLHAGPFNTHCIGKGTHRNWCVDGPWEAPWFDEDKACPDGKQFVNAPDHISEYPLPDDIAATVDGEDPVVYGHETGYPADAPGDGRFGAANWALLAMGVVAGLMLLVSGGRWLSNRMRRNTGHEQLEEAGDAVDDTDDPAAAAGDAGARETADHA